MLVPPTKAPLIISSTFSSKFVFATLFARRGMKYPEQLVYAEKTFDSSYVVFPWDKLEFQNS